MILNNLLGKWILQKEATCIHAYNRNPHGQFTVTDTAILVAIKLAHLHGGFICRWDYTKTSHFGCNGADFYTNNKLAIINIFPLEDPLPTGFYNIADFTGMLPYVIFKGFNKTVYQGMEMNICYSKVFYNQFLPSEDTQTCVSVYAMFCDKNSIH